MLKKPAIHIAVALAGALLAAPSTATILLEEHVTDGELDLVWEPGFGVPNSLEPLLLEPADDGYDNPSGDHTAAQLVNAHPDEGGIAIACTDPLGESDYVWEAVVFTGDGDTRRGLVVRADPFDDFSSGYQFVIQPGLLQLSFRKLVGGTPTTLQTWFTTDLPSGLPGTNEWHSMKIQCIGSEFRLWWDGHEVTSGPIIDSELVSGWVGVYNFRFDIGGIPFLVDDLILSSPESPTPVVETSWGSLKHAYQVRP
jgi:hypothetical protein